jgi:hypothetical protein
MDGQSRGPNPDFRMIAGRSRAIVRSGLILQRARKRQQGRAVDAAGPPAFPAFFPNCAGNF